MYLIDVIPVGKSIGKDRLSYYGARDITPGTIVSVPIRGKDVEGLVIRTRDASHHKGDLKANKFALKKVGTVQAYSLFPPAALELLERAERVFARPAGMILSTVIAKPLLQFLLERKKTKPFTSRDQLPVKTEKILLQRPRYERLSYYKSLVREEFARKHSLLFVAPQTALVEELVQLFERGVSDRVIGLHGSLTPKERSRRLAAIAESELPICVITTPAYAMVPRDDFSTLVVEYEHDTSYRTIRHPLIDFRAYFELYAEASQLRLILADTFARTETIARAERGELSTTQPLSFRLLDDRDVEMIDLTEHTKDLIYEDETGNRLASTITRPLHAKVKAALDASRKVCLVTSRTGTAPTTICTDCGHTLTCQVCNLPLVLHSRRDNGREYLCHYCGTKSPVIDSCPHCESWRLKLYGTGLESLELEATARFPDAKLFIMSKERTPKERDKHKLLEEWQASESSLLLISGGMLPYIPADTNLVGFVDLDVLLNIPSYTIEEEVLHRVIDVTERTKADLIIQSRLMESTVMTSLKSHRLRDFYDETLRERTEFGYPPQSVLLRVSAVSKGNLTDDKRSKLASYLSSFEPDFYIGPAKRHGMKTVHALIRMETAEWLKRVNDPDDELLSTLIRLPQPFRVTINPSTLV